MVINFDPNALTMKVKSVEMHQDSLAESTTEDNFGFNVGKASVKDTKLG